MQRAVVVTLCLLSSLPVWAERVEFLECPKVDFFADDPCGGNPPAWSPQESAPAPAPVVPPALFSPGTMAPDTPPLMLQLLNDPTAANLQAYVQWEHERQQRIKEVQLLLRRYQRGH